MPAETNGHTATLPPPLKAPTRPAPTTRDLALAVLDEALRLCLEAQCVPPAIFEEVERVLFAESRAAAERRALAVATDVADPAPDIRAKSVMLSAALRRLLEVVAPRE